jgi:hypothetical protein
MSKISDKGASHHERPLSIRWRRYYDQMTHDANDQHPVDIAVDKCLGATVTRAQIVRLQERLLAKLGSETAPYLELESLLNEYQREREKCFFDLGYEYGVVESQARTKRAEMRVPREAEILSQELRAQILKARVPAIETMLVLLESAWALAVEQRNG